MNRTYKTALHLSALGGLHGMILATIGAIFCWLYQKVKGD